MEVKRSLDDLNIAGKGFSFFWIQQFFCIHLVCDSFKKKAIIILNIFI